MYITEYTVSFDWGWFWGLIQKKRDRTLSGSDWSKTSTCWRWLEKPAPDPWLQRSCSGCYSSGWSLHSSGTTVNQRNIIKNINQFLFLFSKQQSLFFMYVFACTCQTSDLMLSIHTVHNRSLHRSHLFVVIQDGVHVLDPHGIHRSVEYNPLSVWGCVGSMLSERVSQNTLKRKSQRF